MKTICSVIVLFLLSAGVVWGAPLDPKVAMQLDIASALQKYNAQMENACKLDVDCAKAKAAVDSLAVQMQKNGWVYQNGVVVEAPKAPAPTK